MNDLRKPESTVPPAFSNLTSMNDNEDLFEQLERRCEIRKNARPKIQKVAYHLRSRKDFSQYYFPRMLSLGPIHHGQPYVKLGEQYKLMWASMYVQGDRELAQSLYQRISRKIEELKNLYQEDVFRDRFNDQHLARMLFVDGCALLQMLKNPDILNPEPLNVKVDQLAFIRQDALLLENQLPFRVLQLLRHGPCCNDDNLIGVMDKFLSCHHLGHGPDEKRIDMDPGPRNPAHLLDQLRRRVLSGFRLCTERPKIQESGMITHRNLKELKETGIHVKVCKSKSPVNINFCSCWFSGELKLPKIVVDDTTAPTYLNLMAYEACPDFENEYEISSYVEFLDSLIDHPDDAKELRKAQVLHNGLGSDMEVAELFNKIGSDVVANDGVYAEVRKDIEKHYNNKYKKWWAIAKKTYCSNPWTIVGLIAASLILFLTATQAWFGAFPPHR